MIQLIEATAITGPNIYSHYPVIKLVLDLGEAGGTPTREWGNFNEELLRMLPGLRSHHCSRGRPGGFVQRLQEGTYVGHVLEHVILELQHRCGIGTNYGKTVSGEKPHRVEIIFEYISCRPALYLAGMAIKLVNRLLSGRRTSLDRLQENVDLLRQRFDPGPSTEAIMAEARARDIPVTRLQEGSSLLLLGLGARQKRVQATLTSNTGCLAADLAGDKYMTKLLLERAGIPTPRGTVVNSEEQAVEAARRLGGAVVVKPCDANQGKGVSLNLHGDEEVRQAYRLASCYSSRVMVEEYIVGRHYRLLVVGGKLVAAARRLPAMVTGDGVHTIAELIEIENRNPRRGRGHARPQTRLKVDAVALAVLAKQGKTLEDRPKPGERVLLRENANLSTGGSAWDVTFKVHPFNAALAERAASIIGLDIAGVDLVTPDLKLPLETGKGALIEVNAAPGLRMHLYPSRGRGSNVARAVVDSLFPGGDNGRIPVISVTGTNGKTSTVRLLQRILEQEYSPVGMTTTDGIYIGRRLIRPGDTTGPASARTILEDPSVQAAVLETARGGIIRGGLGYDRSDVAVVTNISADHLGQDGLESIEDLVFIKSLVVEAVSPRGSVILNADDPNVLKMVFRARAPVVFFSCQEGNLVVLRHLQAGGRALLVRDGALYWHQGQSQERLMEVSRIPSAFNGLAVHNLQNALAAAAAAIALGLSPSKVAAGLESFRPSAEDNPGRGNFYFYGSARVLLDYGHNPAALEATLKFASRLGCRRLIGVIGVPGDRSDQLIRRCGRVCAPYLHFAVIKEDADRRGRLPGETARLLREGMRQQPLAPPHRLILDELEAVRYALSLAGEGDLVVVFYEKRLPLEQLLGGGPVETAARPREPESLFEAAT